MSEQATARIAKLEGQQITTSSDVSYADDMAVAPDETSKPESQQPAVEEEVDASPPEKPEVSRPEPTPAPRSPTPTDVDKIFVDTYG